MAAVNLKNMDVNALLALWPDVERVLADRSRDLQRQLTMLGGGGKDPTGPLGQRSGGSTLRGVKTAPKYGGVAPVAWLAVGAAAPACANVITDWDEKAIAAVASLAGVAPPYSPYVAFRKMGMVHAAMFDAVNNFQDRTGAASGRPFAK